VRLTPEEVGPDHGRQLGLWGGSAASEERVARSLARLQGLLGPDAVVTAVLGGGRDPRSQVRLVPWGDPRPSISAARAAVPEAPAAGLETPAAVPKPPAAGPEAPAAGSSRRGGPAVELAPWPGRLPGPAPAVVYPVPLAADVHDGDGEPLVVTGRGEPSGAPASLSLAGGPWSEIRSWAGPWPIDEQWWDSCGRRQARFQLGLDGGVTHLVVREGGRWWVEATYD